MNDGARFFCFPLWPPGANSTTWPERAAGTDTATLAIAPVEPTRPRLLTPVGCAGFASCAYAPPTRMSSPTTTAIVSFGAGLTAYVSGRVLPGETLPLAGALLVLVAAVTRRYGIALPGNGFSSYVLGVMLFGILDRGWAFAAILAPFAMLVGGVLMRRLPLRAALGNAAHLTAGSTFVGLMYARLSGATGVAAASAGTAWGGRAT